MKSTLYALLGTILLVGAFVLGALYISSDKTLGVNAIVNHSLCKLADATSTVSALATSSQSAVLTCDAYHTDTNIYEAMPMESSVLAIQFTAASTTASTLKYVITYSQDGTDWYSGERFVASSTLSNTVTTPVNYLVDVPTPLRYVRATFSNTANGADIATSSVWAEFIPQKEVNK